MTTAQICIIIAIVLYLALMVGIGAWYSKKNKNTDDFYLGGRKLGPLVTAMSAEASDMSSYLLMGLPGLAVVYGIAEASWTAIGLAVGTYVNWLLVAKRIRLYSHKINAVTIPEFFAKRFHDNAKVLSLIAALIIIIFFVPYTASGFSACGKLFSSLFGVDYQIAMIISAVVIVLYTTLGGFSAASTTDLIQSIVMTVALFVVVGFGVSQAGGVHAVLENASQLPAYFSLTSTGDGAGGTTPYGGLTIVSTLAWGLGYFGMPHILLRFMAIEDSKKLKTSRRIASVWVVISMAVAIFIGTVGVGMVGAGVLDGGFDGERVIIEISKLLSTYGIFPALVAGVILSGILAATMSTADSQLLAASSSASQDIFISFFKVKLSQKKAMLIARASVVLISVIGVIIALDENSSIFRVVSFAWAGFGAAFGPLVLFSLFWKRTNKAGAVAGMVTGGAMVFIWKYVIAKLSPVLNIYELLPAFILSSLAIVAVSLLTKAPDKAITDEFDAVKAMQ
ncbi:MAG: sodium/proline symporter PutP [Ruminococcus sp.]|nr:sodium/proline symporter PutP [Ruminococcus sp.]